MNVSELKQHFESTFFLNVPYVGSGSVFRDWNWRSSPYKVNGKLIFHHKLYFIIIVGGSQTYTVFRKSQVFNNFNELLQDQRAAACILRMGDFPKRPIEKTSSSTRDHSTPSLRRLGKSSSLYYHYIVIIIIGKP